MKTLALVNNKRGVGKTTLAPRPITWRICHVVLLAVPLLAVSAMQVEGAQDDAAAAIVPDGGRVVQQGERLDIYDAKSQRTGYGIQRGDGSVDVFNTDGSRRATIQPRPGGGVRVTTPAGKR